MNGNGDSWIRSIRGPLTVITVGVLFAFNNFTQYSFDKTWPVLLIVFGLLSLLRRTTEPAYPPPPPPPSGYPFNPPPPPGPYDPVTGAYRGPQQPPPPPPSGPAGRGGFGASAPPRSAGDSPAEPPPSGGTL
jgi:hypothetical protein